MSNMPAPSRAASVFISYSRQDKAFVEKLMEALATDGREVWVDWESIEKGTAWLERIKAGIENQDTFVFVISPDSLTSEICNVEVAHAIAHNKRIIPLVRRDVIENKKLLPAITTAWFGTTWRDTVEAEQNWEKLQSINFLFCREADDFATAVAELDEAINTDLDHLKLHTNLMRGALEWQRHNKPTGFLIREHELEEAEAWLSISDTEAKAPPPTPLHREYIAAARAYENRVTRRVRLLRSATMGLLAAGVVFLIVAIFASITATNANQNADRAENRQSTAQAEAILANNDQQTSEARAVNAQNTLTPIPRTLESLMATGTAIVVALDEQERLAESRRLAAEARTILDDPNGDAVLATLLGIRALQQGWLPETAAEMMRAGPLLSTIRAFDGHESSVIGVAFAPDGQSILTGSADHTAKIWDVQTSELIQTFSGHDDFVTSVAFSSDGQTIITGSKDTTARIWDVETGQTLHTLSHRDEVWGVAFAPDGKTVLTGNYDGIARLWDVGTGELIRSFEGHSDYIWGVAFAPDGQAILTGSSDQTAKLWDINTGEVIQTFAGHDEGVLSVAFAPDGNAVLTGSADKTAHLWDVGTGEILQEFNGHGDQVWTVAFAPNGLSVLTGALDNTARLWDVETGQQMRIFRGHADWVLSVAFSPDSQSVLTGSDDGTTRLWSIYTTQTPEVFANHDLSVDALAFSPDGRTVLTGSADTTAKLWDATTHELLQTFAGHDGPITSLAFAPDGQTILTGSWDTTARLWDVETGQQMRVFADHTELISSIAFAPDSKTMVTGSWDDTVKLWDVATGQLLRTFDPPTGEGNVLSVAFSPDGKTIATAGADTDIHIWRVETGKLILSIVEHNLAVSSVAFALDGQTILTGSWDNTARLWDAQTGHLLQTFGPHEFQVWKVAFAPDGQTVLTSTLDTVRLWNVNNGYLVGSYTSTNFVNYTIGSVVFAPDSKHFLTGSGDGRVRVWQILPYDTVEYACALVFRDFTPEERDQYGIPDGPTCPQFASSEE